MKRRCGQAATEYIMISAFALMVIIPAAYFFYSYSHSAEQRIRDAQVTRLATDIANNAEQVFYLGYPSKITLEEVMPANVEGIFIYRDWNQKTNHLNFVVRTTDGISEYNFPLRVNVLGFYGSRDYGAGTKLARMMAMYNASGSPYVLVTFIGDCFASVTYDVNNDRLVDPGDFGECVGCSGRQATGICEYCDYDGDCQVTNNDLVIQNILSFGNSPPTAIAQGPSSAVAGTSVNFKVSAEDVDSNLASIRLYARLTGSPASTVIGSCSLGPVRSGECQVSYSFPGAGSYYVYPEASDTASLACSGNPAPLAGGMADCGYYDFQEVQVS
ncbi:hypothetical protein HYY74_01250 [Candidatus Woesearchaeota archaeon]|nr:hypothetical protein [Candidatus Woesearchaeota archaeon]